VQSILIYTVFASQFQSFTPFSTLPCSGAAGGGRQHPPSVIGRRWSGHDFERPRKKKEGGEATPGSFKRCPIPSGNISGLCPDAPAPLGGRLCSGRLEPAVKTEHHRAQNRQKLPGHRFGARTCAHRAPVSLCTTRPSEPQAEKSSKSSNSAPALKGYKKRNERRKRLKKLRDNTALKVAEQLTEDAMLGDVVKPAEQEGAGEGPNNHMSSRLRLVFFV
jgi:hypothetical protein